MATIEKRNPDDLTPDHENVRSSMDERELEGLAKSFASVGQIQPCVVDETGRIIAGHRRHAAAKLGVTNGILPADWQLDVIVRANGDQQKRTAQQLVENIQRVDIDPIDEAMSYLRLGEMGLNQKEIAEEVGKSNTHVSHRLMLLRLPEPQQRDVRTNKMPVSTAVKLARLFDKDEERAMQVVTSEHIYRGGNVDPDAIDRLLEAVKRDELFVKAQERASEFGITAVALKDVAGYMEPPEGSIAKVGEPIVEPDDKTLKGIEDDVLGLSITYDGKVAYYRIDIVKAKKDSKTPDEAAKLMRDIRAHRDSFFVEVLSDQVSKDTAADVMLAGLLQLMTNSDARKVCKWLGIEITDEHKDEVMGTDYTTPVLDAVAGGSTRQISKIATAIVMAHYGTPHPHLAYADQPSRRWLEALGYEPHPAE